MQTDRAAAAPTSKRTRNLISRIVAALMVVSSLVSIVLGKQYPLQSIERLALALVPVPFFLAGIGVIVWGARSCDELHRRIQFEALAFAFAASIALVHLVGAVQFAGYMRDFGMAETLMGILLLYVAGLGLAWNRYR